MLVMSNRLNANLVALHAGPGKAMVALVALMAGSDLTMAGFDTTASMGLAHLPTDLLAMLAVQLMGA